MRDEITEFEMIRATRGALNLLSVRLGVDVLYLLASGTRRFSQLYYEVGEVSKKTLTHTLRTLERDGLINRRAYAEIPPRVEYSLTRLGRSLREPLGAVQHWAEQHVGTVMANRERADQTA